MYDHQYRTVRCIPFVISETICKLSILLTGHGSTQSTRGSSPWCLTSFAPTPGKIPAACASTAVNDPVPPPMSTSRDRGLPSRFGTVSAPTVALTGHCFGVAPPSLGRMCVRHRAATHDMNPLSGQ